MLEDDVGGNNMQGDDVQSQEMPWDQRLIFDAGHTSFFLVVVMKQDQVLMQQDQVLMQLDQVL